MYIKTSNEHQHLIKYLQKRKTKTCRDSLFEPVHLHKSSEWNDSLKWIIVRYERANCIDGYTNQTKNTLIYIKQNIEQQQ